MGPFTVSTSLRTFLCEECKYYEGTAYRLVLKTRREAKFQPRKTCSSVVEHRIYLKNNLDSGFDIPIKNRRGSCMKPGRVTISTVHIEQDGCVLWMVLRQLHMFMFTALKTIYRHLWFASRQNENLDHCLQREKNIKTSWLKWAGCLLTVQQPLLDIRSELL